MPALAPSERPPSETATASEVLVDVGAEIEVRGGGRDIDSTEAEAMVLWVADEFEGGLEDWPFDGSGALDVGTIEYIGGGIVAASVEATLDEGEAAMVEAGLPGKLGFMPTAWHARVTLLFTVS
jgi:hypothetical protein